MLGEISNIINHRIYYSFSDTNKIIIDFLITVIFLHFCFLIVQPINMLLGLFKTGTNLLKGTNLGMFKWNNLTFSYLQLG